MRYRLKKNVHVKRVSGIVVHFVAFLRTLVELHVRGEADCLYKVNEMLPENF